MKALSDGDVCEYGQCNHAASEIAYSRRKNEVMALCERCAELVLDEHSPEYTHHCENCGCGLPIN